MSKRKDSKRKPVSIAGASGISEHEGRKPSNTSAIQESELKKAAEICDFVIEGDSVKQASYRVGLEPTMFYRMLAQQYEKEGARSPLLQHYARAREARAETRFERIDEILYDMRIGAITPEQARVMIDAIKWQTGKENAKRYGDKVELEHTGEQKHTITFKRG